MTTGSFARSKALFDKAEKIIPGGVSSPVRAFRHVGMTPIMMKRGEGAFLYDEDDNKYLDFNMAWGPLILGHAHPAVVEAVTRTARDGLAFGTCHRHEGELAELVTSGLGMERVRFVVSGTEAVLTATRLARAVTKRKLLVKFSGCYHGHVDSLLVKAGSGVVTQGLADSAGVTETTARDTLVVPLGDTAALEQAFAQHGDQIAAVITEPLPANNGLLIQPLAWLQALRAITTKHSSLLIFDEVITGFRLHFGGYGKLVGVTPDLTTLGKIVGGGLPVGAIAGRKELLERLAPLGDVYQAGTMAGNPVALAAGIATLTQLHKDSPYAQLERLGAQLEKKLASHDKPLRLARVGSILWPYLDAKTPPTRAEEIAPVTVQRFKRHFGEWLSRGVYMPPSAYEVAFLSTAHTEQHVDLLAKTLLETVTT